MHWDERRKARERLLREQRTVFKDWGGRLPIALIYPNSYYVGMSNLGLHTVYRLFNNHKNIVCERLFWEKDDQGKKLFKLSLESQRPLSDFSVLAFSVTYELDYFNIVGLLKASGIPLYSGQREERHPLVMAGGPCIMANPMPLAPFFDLLCIGEAESILPSVISVLTRGIGVRRSELLKALAEIPGVWVPHYHSGTPVVRQWVDNLDDFPVTSNVITSDTELGNLYLLEVERGCSHGCRFCLVGAAFSPMRFRSQEKLIEQAKVGLEYRKRLGLVGPVVSDYPGLEELLSKLLDMGAGLSSSSLRASPLPHRVIEELAKGGSRTITLAPEAGSERLRQVIKKGISEDDVLKAASRVSKQRQIKKLKLYFMIGLPSETDEDIEGIIDLALNCKRILDRGQTGCRLDLNLAPFVPKAGTPFQWLPMASQDVLNHRLSMLKRRLLPQGVRLKGESLAWSEIQGVLARGDTKVAEALAAMDVVSLAGWRGVVEKCHLDLDFYVYQKWDTNYKLPWAIIDSGTEVDKLRLELLKALSLGK